MYRRFVVSYEPKYSRGSDDIEDPLPKDAFFAHVHWNYRTKNDRTNKIMYHDLGYGDLYFYKTSDAEWSYEFRFKYDDGRMEFRCGDVLSKVDCNWFMMWFIEYMNAREE